MRKIFYLIVAIVAVVVIAMIVGKSGKPVSQTASNQSAPVASPNPDSVAGINQDLQSLNVADLDQEFKDIDANLISL